MKKTCSTLFLFFVILNHSFSQKNEIKFNIASAIGGFPELNYERIIDDNITFGAAAAVAVEKPEKMDTRYSFMPYSRLYFGKKKADGFFIEANIAFRGQRDLHYEDYYDTLTHTITPVKFDRSSNNFGFGAAIGVKLLTKKAAFGEIFAGAGRLFGSPIKDVYFRGGVSLGIRF